MTHRRTLKRNGIKIEAHGMHLIDDLVIECVWRITISLTNYSRRPRRLPTLAARATVSARRKVYLAQVFLERHVYELSPNELALIEVDFVLPAGLTPQRMTISELPTGKQWSFALQAIGQDGTALHALVSA